MITFNISLSLFTILARKFIDRFTGKAAVPVRYAPCPKTTLFLVVTGALFYLYKNIKNGNLVKIGIKIGMLKNSSNIALKNFRQQRSLSKSLLMKTTRACRSAFGSSLYKFAKQSYADLRSNKSGTTIRKSSHFTRSHKKVNTKRPQLSSKGCPATQFDVLYDNRDYEPKASWETVPKPLKVRDFIDLRDKCSKMEFYKQRSRGVKRTRRKKQATPIAMTAVMNSHQTRSGKVYTYCFK